MLAHMAQRLSSFFIRKNIIKDEERPVYDYCFEILLSTLINLIVVIVIAIISGTIIQTLFFMAGFIAIRTTAGGFHAKTHLGCLLTLLFSYSLYLTMLFIIPDYIKCIMSAALSLIAIILVVLFSPVEDANKTFSQKEYISFKIRSRVAVVTASVVVLLLAYFWSNIQSAFSMAAGMCTVALSLIAGTVKNHLQKHQREEE